MHICRTVLAATLLTVGTACHDLPSEPRANEEPLLASDSVATLAVASVKSWYLASTFYEPFLMLESTADATTGNCCWVRFMNMEPRIPFENDAAGGEANAIRAWDMNYSVISDASDAIRALNAGIEIGDGADATARTRAAALFALAGAHSNLALVFDSAFVNTGARTSGADSALRGYAEVRDSALALWDELLALTKNASWQWDYTTLPTPAPITADRLNRIASTMAARTLLLASRTAAENSANQWARILAYAEGGITGSGSSGMDFAILNDQVDWRNYITLYGPYADRFRVDQRLIHRMAPNIPATFNGLETQPLPVYGRGENVRDWLHVEDHARALETIIRHGRVGQSYNVGARSERTNLQVVEAICDLVDERLGGEPRRELITFVDDRPGHDRRYAIDASKLRDELGWEPRYTFERGIAETVDWYLEHQDWVNRVLDGSYRLERIGAAA